MHTPRVFFIVAILLWHLTPGASRGQVRETFSSGNFHTEALWEGDTALWTFASLDGEPAIRLASRAAADTVLLSTPTYMPFGRWEVDFAYEGGRLSNFNLFRIYLLAADRDLRSNPEGYYLQIGANTRDIRLFRSDPHLSAGRTLLGAAPVAQLEDDAAVLRIAVERDESLQWRVYVDEQPLLVIEERGRAHLNSRWGGIWVRHTATRNQDYRVSRVHFTPPDDPLPLLLSSALERDLLFLEYDGRIFPPSVHEARLDVNQGGLSVLERKIQTMPDPIRDVLTVQLSDRAEPGSIELHLSGLRDMAGGVLPVQHITFEVLPDSGLTELVVMDAARLRLAFDRDLETASVTDVSRYRLTPATALVTEVVPDGTRQLTLHLDRVLDRDADHVLEISGIRDARGNDLDPSRIALRIDAGDVSPPRLVSAWSTGGEWVLLFDRALDPLSACSFETFAFEAAPARSRHPASVRCGPMPITTLVLENGDLPEGLYSLVIRGVRSAWASAGTTILTHVFEGSIPPPSPGEIVVSEIFYAPADDRHEFFEIFNRSDRAIDLAALSFSDDRARPIPLSDHPRILPPGGYGVIARNSAALESAFGPIHAVQPPQWYILRRSGDAVILYHDGITIDSVAYRPSWGGDGVSLERIDPAAPSNLRSNWASSRDPRGATPGAENSVHAPDLAPPTPIFADQVDERTFEVLFGEPVVADLAAQASIGGSTSASIVPTDDPNRLRAVFASPPSGTHVTISGVADLSGNRLVEAELPVAWQPEPGETIINEIMFDPRVDRHDPRPDQPHYVELHNVSTRLVSLRGGFWTDEPGRDGAADTLRFPGEAIAIAPGGFALIIPRDGPDLGTAFPEIPGGTTTVRLPRRTLPLPNTGTMLRIHRPDHMVLDQVRYTASWHHPGLVETRGIALERILPHGPSQDGLNWGSSTFASGGSPGHSNGLMTVPAEQPEAPGIRISPSPFSPTGDGRDDVTVIQYRLGATASLVRALVFDQRGRRVRELNPAMYTGETGRIVWDGLGDDGQTLRIGIYIVLLEAVDARGGTTERHRGTVVLARPL
jgi:hypothetical protein